MSSMSGLGNFLRGTRVSSDCFQLIFIQIMKNHWFFFDNFCIFQLITKTYDNSTHIEQISNDNT